MWFHTTKLWRMLFLLPGMRFLPCLLSNLLVVFKGSAHLFGWKIHIECQLCIRHREESREHAKHVPDPVDLIVESDNKQGNQQIFDYKL